MCVCCVFLALGFGAGALPAADPGRGRDGEYLADRGGSGGRARCLALDAGRGCSPNRTAARQSRIADLLAKLKGHRVGLVAFAGRAQVLCPLTPDYGFFRMILDRTDPRSVGRGSGIYIGDGLRLAKATFSAGPGARLVLLITDGEDHDSFPLEAAQELKRDGIRVVAIGFGDERGSEITLTDPATRAKSFRGSAGPASALATRRQDAARHRARDGGAYIPAGVATL